jgi:hypothetical protein
MEKIILWMIILTVGCNLIVAKSHTTLEHFYATAVGLCGGFLFGLFVHRRKLRKENFSNYIQKQ